MDASALLQILAAVFGGVLVAILLVEYIKSRLPNGEQLRDQQMTQAVLSVLGLVEGLQEAMVLMEHRHQSNMEMHIKVLEAANQARDRVDLNSNTVKLAQQQMSSVHQATSNLHFQLARIESYLIARHYGERTAAERAINDIQNDSQLTAE